MRRSKHHKKQARLLVELLGAESNRQPPSLCLPSGTRVLSESVRRIIRLPYQGQAGRMAHLDAMVVDGARAWLSPALPSAKRSIT